MAKLKKSVQLQNLHSYRVWIDDNDPSSAYFRVKEVPEVLTAGKNAFLIDGSEFLAGEVLVEIIDADGKSVFCQPVRRYLEGLARLVSIEVYEDTAPGQATLTILGRAKADVFGNTPPDEFVGAFNVRWQKRITIAPERANTTPIRLYKRPLIKVSERLVTYRQPTAPAAVTVATGSVVLSTYQSAPNIPATRFVQLSLVNQPTTFIRDMIGGQFMATINGLPFTGSISEVVNSSMLRISESVTFSSGSTQTTLASWKVVYTPPNSYTSTFLSRSFAEVTLTRLTTFAGDIQRAKIYAKSVDLDKQYQQIIDTPLESRFLTTTQSLATGDVNVRMGFPTNLADVNAYWQGGTILNSSAYAVGGVTLTYDSTRLLDAVRINSAAVSASSSTPQFFMGLTKLFDMTGELEYSLDFKFACGKTIVASEARMDVYLVGSAFPATQDSPLGKKLATYLVPTGQESRVFGPTTLNIEAIADGTAQLRFVVYSGDWNVSEVELTSARETGFNPDEVTVLVPINNRRLEKLVFKAELLDVNSNLVPVSIETDPVFFDGGNFVIRGVDNKVTEGKLVIGNDPAGGIVFTTLGYTGSTGPLVNLPAIYIGKGQYSSSNTPFIVASGSAGQPIMSLGDRFLWDGTNLTLVGVLRQRLPSDGGGTMIDYVNRGTWSQPIAYFVNDLVQYSGSTYAVSINHTSTPLSNPVNSGSLFILFAQGGSTGSIGLSGPGVVYRGPYSATLAYFKTADRRDIVDFQSNYYIALNTAKSGLTTWANPTGSDWQPFGAQFSSVATDILLAQNANITKGLVLGSLAGNVGFLRSANASILGGIGIYMDGSGSLFIGSGSQASGFGNWLNFDKTNLQVQANQFKLTAPNLKIDSAASGSGVIALGAATAFMTGSGIYMDGAGRFRAGNPTGGYLSYSGSVLVVDSLDSVNDGGIYGKVRGDASVNGIPLADAQIETFTSEGCVDGNDYTRGKWRDYLGLAGTSGSIDQTSEAGFGGSLYKGNGRQCRYLNQLIPFDPNRLYIARIRFRQRTAVISGGDLVNVGFFGVQADGVTYVTPTGATGPLGTNGFEVVAASHNPSVTAAWTDKTGYVQGWGAVTGSTGERPDPLNPAKMHPTVRYLVPYFQHGYANGVGGEFDVDYFLYPSPGNNAEANAVLETERQLFTIMVDDGILAVTTKQDVTDTGGNNTATELRMIKGLQHNYGTSDVLTHGVPYVFPIPFSREPFVHLSGGIVFEPDASKWVNNTYSSTVRTYELSEAQDITAAGFTPWCVLRQAGSLYTTKTLNWATSNTTGSMLTLTEPSYNNNYTLRFRTTVTAAPKQAGGAYWAECDGQAYIESWVASSGVWTRRATVFASAESFDTPVTVTQTQVVTVNVSGMIAGSKFRFLLGPKTVTGNYVPGGSWSVAATAPGLTYQTATASDAIAARGRPELGDDVLRYFALLP
jgi:hypothetical protein